MNNLNELDALFRNGDIDLDSYNRERDNIENSEHFIKMNLGGY